MRLSIIVPVYNSKETIERALQSVIEQKNSDIELIVIDGGSDDGTLDIVNKYRDYIDHFVSERDKGYSDALNKGINQASMEWVMMLAADDILLPNVIARVSDSIKSDTEVWCGALYERYHWGFKFSESDSDLEKLKVCCSLRHPATIFKRVAFAEYGDYDITFRCAADRELFLRMYLGGAKFQIEKIPIVEFSTAGMSNKNYEAAMAEDKKISEKYGFEKDRVTYINEHPSNLSMKGKIHALLEKSGWMILIVYAIMGKSEWYMSEKKI